MNQLPETLLTEILQQLDNGVSREKLLQTYAKHKVAVRELFTVLDGLENIKAEVTPDEIPPLHLDAPVVEHSRQRNHSSVFSNLVRALLPLGAVALVLVLFFATRPTNLLKNTNKLAGTTNTAIKNTSGGNESGGSLTNIAAQTNQSTKSGSGTISNGIPSGTGTIVLATLDSLTSDTQSLTAAIASLDDENADLTTLTADAGTADITTALVSAAGGA